MKYFLHDTAAFQDEKIAELYMQFGYEGIGLYYTILEKLAEREKPVRTVTLKRQLFVGKKLEKIWAFLEKTELIWSKNDETFAEKIANDVETFDKKRESTKKRVSQHRENQSISKNVTRYDGVTDPLQDALPFNNNLELEIERKEKNNQHIITPPAREVVVASDRPKPQAKPAPPPSPLSEEPPDLLAEYEQQMLTSGIFIENTAINLKRSADWVRNKISEYVREQRSKGKDKGRTYDDVRTHCYDWIRIQHNNESRNANRQTNSRPTTRVEPANGRTFSGGKSHGFNS